MATQLLLIEDDPQIRENMAELLTLKGYAIETASDGQEGIMQAMLRRPDLILCDVMMPQLNGYQVLEMIRANQSLATVPFIFLTAKADTTDLRLGMNSGADDYLTKPFTSSDLVAAIESRLRQEKRRVTDVQEQVEKHWNQLSQVSTHEYNTPLTGIIGFAHLLKDYYESFDKAQTQSMLGMIIACCRRLKRTIDNNQLANKLLQTPASSNPLFTEGSSSLSAEVVNQILTAIGERNDQAIDAQTDIVNAHLHISGGNLRKVLEELLDNALKFSSPTSSIRITGRPTKEHYQLTITNQGRGFTAENIANIAPYTQFDRTLYEQQGTGLGLFISKRLVELNNGHLSISSQVDGPTTVTVDLLTIVHEAAETGVVRSLAA